MGRKTYTEIQKELTNKRTAEKNLKKRVSTLEEESLRYKSLAKSLPVQYERIIKEYKKTLDTFLENSWKLVFIIVSKKMSDGWKRIRGK